MDPKHEELYAVKETICYKNIKYFSKQEMEKNSFFKKSDARRVAVTHRK